MPVKNTKSTILKFDEHDSTFPSKVYFASLLSKALSFTGDFYLPQSNPLYSNKSVTILIIHNTLG